MSLRAAGYVRELAIERALPELSAAEQRRQIEAYCAGHGIELAKVFEDASGAAGSGTGRRGFEAMLGDLAGLDKLVVERIDRLGHRTRRISKVMKLLSQAGVDLVSVKEGFDTGSATGKALPGLLEVIAAWELPAVSTQGQGWASENLRRSFSPATVIDVGVASGTPTFYEAFPDAVPVLIEPLVEFEPDLRELAERFGGEYLLAAAGATEGEIEINVDPIIFMSSLLRPVRPRAPAETRSVPVVTLDGLLEKRRWKPPFGLKIDAEGFEHHVIRGASKLLEATQFVIVEVSVSKRFEEGASSEELVALMRSHGFEVFDIIDADRSPLGSHADVRFVRRA